MRLIEYLLASERETEDLELVPFREWHDVRKNQLVFIVKPEITALGAQAEPVLDMVDQQLARWNCDILAARLLGPSYLRRHRLIDQHYGAINKYSLGGSHLLLQAPPELEGTPVLGAHEFLESHPEMDPETLLSLHGKSPTIRLQQGAYAFLYSNMGESVLIVNGFHPAQLDHFYTAPAPILVLEVSSDAPWNALRNVMVGATDPRAAESGSMRSALLKCRSDWGIEFVDSMRNGVHLSAGPLEGGQELRRFFASEATGPIAVQSTNAGAILSSKFGGARTKAMLENSADAERDLYSETELMDTWQLADWIAKWQQIQ